MVAKIDGNAKCSHHGDVASIASSQPSKMAWMPQSEMPRSEVPRSAVPESAVRPPLTSHQSNSLPSTPYQHARNLSFHSRSPSPARGSTSPRSTHSEATHLPPFSRKPLGGCKYETAMAYFRRRIPYSLGADILPEEKEGVKEKLDPDEEKKLSADIMDLYDRLLPSAESDDRRRQLVRKLEKLFNDQWPGHNIKANIFGSSGNKLCSSDSDVDICITTNYKELEHVCLLAEVLAKHGMQRVVCVSHAKVPIVKIWDPELRLACDMNVNNTLALENTRMIRTYVEVDERVRPLAMTIKHWTKRRNLNDAALGGTLSSYTWICLIISFLQTRDPPILPSLQARPHKKRMTHDGVVCSFDDDLKTLSQFGRKNKQSVGELLFKFFRYYAHEIDYETSVISVRDGGLINKEAKGWHLLMNNRLCVEEPFNTGRNLGNTADDTSFRGLHLELRRAFKYIAKGDLEGCCEQFEFPPEEERTWERPPPQPRPTLTPSLPSRGGRGGNRGGRYNNQFTRGGLTGGRRQSNTGNKSNFRQPNTGTTPDISLHAQQQAQYLLHDQLYQQIQLLQAQEQELRMQLHNQALITGRPPPVFIRQPFIQFPVPQQQEFPDETSRPRSGTASHATLSPTQRQQTIYNPSYAAVGATGSQSISTNPPSPSAASVLPDTRRNSRRLSAANGSPKSLRAHSQPARPQGSPSLPSYIPLYTMPPPTENWSKQRLATESSEGGDVSGDENVMRSNSLASNGSRSNSVDENRQQDVLGYYITPQQLHAFQQGTMLPPLATQMGVVSNGYSFIPIQQDYRPGSFSSETARSENTPAPKPSSQSSQSVPRSAASGPLIVDGSVRPSEPRSYAPELIDPYSAASHYTSSDDHNMNTPASFSDSLSQDYQDSGSFDLEHSATFTQSSIESQKPNGVGTEKQPDVNDQTELLASRLQNYHLSNSEKLVQQTPKTSADRPRNGLTQGTGKEAGQPRNSAQTGDKAAASGPNESRYQPPNSKRRTNGDNSDKANGVHGKSKPKGQGRQDASHNPAPGSKDRHMDQPRRSGGQANGANDSNHGWQTTKKKSRKNTKSSADSRNGINGGPESIPTDDSLRKGG